MRRRHRPVSSLLAPVFAIILIVALLVSIGAQTNPLFWCRLLFARFKALAGRTPHPAMLRSWTVRVDASQVRRAAQAGEPLMLQVGSRSVELQLQPAPVASDDASVITLSDEEEIDRTQISEATTFAGTVAGEPGSSVRLTVTDTVVTGYVMSGDEWWFIEPMRKFRRQAPIDQYVTYRTRDLVFRLPFGDDSKPSGSSPPREEIDRRHSVNPEIGIAVWADLDYRTQANIIGMNWWDAQASVINNVNGIYRDEVDIDFRVQVFVLHVGSVLSSTNAETLLDQLGVRVRALHGDIRQASVRRTSGIEVAHLTTGKNLDGRTLGVAWQPGVWGLSEQQLFWIGGGGGLFGGGPNLAFQNMMIAAHELGHNFNGEHDQAEKRCNARFIICWDWVRTIMWPQYHDDNLKRFSSTNRGRIQNNARSGRGVNFTHP